MKYSEYDNKGALCVDCTECKYGYNGDKSCAGARYRKPYQGNCFSGELIEELK